MRRSYISGYKKRTLKAKKQQEINQMQGALTKFTYRLNEVADTETQENKCSAEAKEHCMAGGTEECSMNNLSKDQKHNEKSVPEEPEGSQKLTAATESVFEPEDEAEEPEDFQKLVADVALIDNVTDEIREYFLKNSPPQNIKLASATERTIGDRKRCLTENHFYRLKCNQEKVKRDWMTLSPTTLSVFCWVCKLYSKTPTAMSSGGFSDWKHATERLREHENSYSHRESVCLMIQRKETSSRVDSLIVEKADCESKYWFEVLRRVVAVTKYLATRGLPFFGENETIGSLSNGNFLGCLELMSEFDPFLAKHLEKYGNPGSGRTSYLSSTIINDFIDLMAKKVFDVIIAEIKASKFYSIILDSTPDITYTDQLTFVVRYVSSDCEAIERFLTFIAIGGHSSKYLADTVTDYIQETGLDIRDCRGQSYDNASNMAGKYAGLQAQIKMINPLAEFVPCSAHSLNLVVVKAVECNGKVLDFFTFLQELYNFFSRSTFRWQLLISKMKEGGDYLTLKSRANTRWCANAAATKAVRQNYKAIMQCLYQLNLSADQDETTKKQACDLHKKMLKLETAICAITWDSVLQRIDSINKLLQNPSIDLSTVPDFFMSLIEFVSTVRTNYEIYEEEACTLVGHARYNEKRQTTTPKRFYDGQCKETVFNARESFKISCFYVACDNLITQLKFRMSAYDDTLSKFSCLFEKDKQKMYANAKILQKTYSCDLEEAFADEFTHAYSVIKNERSLTKKLKKIHKLGVVDTFANVDTALRLFLTLPISNASGERSFSTLKRIKSPLRNCMSHSKLNSLALLAIEGDVTVKLDYEDIISIFTAKKVRRKHIKNH